MKIIMVCGVIGSGKDYFLEQYKKEHPDEEVVEIKFAEPLKAIIGNMYSIDVSDKSKYEEWKNKPENRLLLQNLAEGIKDNLSQTIFAKKAVDRMNEYVFSCYNREFIKLPTFIISDFRYKEELDVVFNYINYTLCSICTYELYVYFTNYISDRYDKTNTHKSEKMAQDMVKDGYETGYYDIKLYGTDVLKLIKCNDKI